MYTFINSTNQNKRILLLSEVHEVLSNYNLNCQSNLKL